MKWKHLRWGFEPCYPCPIPATTIVIPPVLPLSLSLYIYIYIYIYTFMNFHHTTCESTCYTLSSSAANLGDNTVSVARYIYIYIYIYTYIYIYIYIYQQPDSFVVSQLFSVARLTGRLKLGSRPDQLYVRLSIIPLSQQANHVNSGIIRHYVVAFVCLHFALSYTWVVYS